MEKKVAAAETGENQLEEGEIRDSVMKDKLEQMEKDWGATAGPIEEGLKLLRQSTSSTRDCSIRDLRVEANGVGVKPSDVFGSLPNEDPQDQEMFLKICDAFHMRLSRMEKFLNMDGTETYVGDGHPDRFLKQHISKEAMLDGIIDAIRQFGSDYGVGKPLIKKHLTTRLGIDLTSQYYAKKLNNIIKYGIGKNLFVFDRHDQLFKLK